MEWKTVKLGEVCEILDKKRIPLSSMERESRQGEYPYYGAQGIIDHINDYIFDEDLLLVAEDGANLETRNEDIAIIASGKYWVNNHAHVLKDNGQLNLRILHYLLNHMDITPYITGSAQPKLNQANLVKIELCIPDIEAQRRIAAILSSLDDKIENNNRINANLEAQAQALFKSWFVDFEPWGGVMPEDWKEGVLGDILTESKEKVGERIVEEYSVGKQGIRKRSEIYHKKITSNPASNKLLKRGQIVFGMGSGLVDWDVMEDEIGATSPAYTVYEVSKSVPSMYFKRFFAIMHSKALDLVKPSVRQGQGLDKGVLMSKYIYFPSSKVWEEFTTICNPLLDCMANNQQESLRLAKLRDTLLPKLMKGEINI